MKKTIITLLLAVFTFITVDAQSLSQNVIKEKNELLKNGYRSTLHDTEAGYFLLSDGLVSVYGVKCSLGILFDNKTGQKKCVSYVTETKDECLLIFLKHLNSVKGSANLSLVETEKGGYIITDGNIPVSHLIPPVQLSSGSWVMVKQTY